MSTTRANLTISDDKASRRLTSRDLPVVLTTAELLERGKQAAQAMTQKGRVEQEAKAAADGFKQEIKSIDIDIRTLMRAIDTGREMRPVEVEIVKHYDLGEIVTTRTDTGEVIQTRPMTWEERQMKMGFDDEDED